MVSAVTGSSSLKPSSHRVIQSEAFHVVSAVTGSSSLKQFTWSLQDRIVRSEAWAFRVVFAVT